MILDWYAPSYRANDTIQRLRPIEVRMLLKRFENKVGINSTSSTNKLSGSSASTGSRIDLRKFIEFIRSKQPSTDVQIKFKRILAKADLGK